MEASQVRQQCPTSPLVESTSFSAMHHDIDATRTASPHMSVSSISTLLRTHLLILIPQAENMKGLIGLI